MGIRFRAQLIELLSWLWFRYEWNELMDFDESRFCFRMIVNENESWDPPSLKQSPQSWLFRLAIILAESQSDQEHWKSNRQTNGESGQSKSNIRRALKVGTLKMTQTIESKCTRRWMERKKATRKNRQKIEIKTKYNFLYGVSRSLIVCATCCLVRNKWRWLSHRLLSFRITKLPFRNWGDIRDEIFQFRPTPNVAFSFESKLQ